MILITLAAPTSSCRRQHGSGDDGDADAVIHDPDGDIALAADADRDASEPGDAEVDEDSPADHEDAPAVCDPVPEFYQGNDAAFVHDCGYPCESDWCSCEACLILAGPNVEHPAGRYEVVFYGGQSGTLTYTFSVYDSTAGRELVSASATYSTFFNHAIEFTSPTGCHRIEYRVSALQDICARIYDVSVARLD